MPVGEHLPSEKRVDGRALDAFCLACLRAAGADEPTAKAAAAAMLHGSRLGVDSHGVRLLKHYVDAIIGGRITANPNMRFVREVGATAALDADNGHGALAAFLAMDRAMALAGTHGIGAVAIARSSHFGPAGTYAVKAAEAGLIGFTVCGASALVRLHGGTIKFHGTNPIAFAAPVPGERPWLLDMATSSASFNKVKLYEALGRALPPGVGSEPSGLDTLEPGKVAMLAPLGGEFGYKGAGLAGMVDILSAALTGMALSFEMMRMFGTDMSVPRNVGAFVMALKPSAFIEQAVFDAAMRRYVDALRGSPTLEGAKVMAAGDKEWAEADRREQDGIPLDDVTWRDYGELAGRFSLEPLTARA